MPPVGPAMPIKRVWRKDVWSGGPTIALAEIDAPHHLPACPLVGRGVDEDPELAERKAIGEALERHAACLPPRARIIAGTPEELGDRVARTVHAPEHEPRWWCEVTRVRDGAPRLVPLELVQLASTLTVRDPIARVDSTGMALHVTRAAAIAAAHAELVERGGLTAILAGAGRPCAVPCDALAAWLARGGYAERLYRVTRFAGFAVVCAVMHRIADVDAGPALVCGAGADRDLAAAVERARREAYAQLVHAIEAWPMRPLPGLPRPYDRFLHYHDAAAARALLEAWPVASQDEPEPSTPEIDDELLVVDRGNALLDQLGLHAVQVLSPGFPRLDEHATVAGLPHPFA